jgi:hypothetical protein
MKEVKVREYGGWTLYTSMKQNKETSCNCCKWGEEGVEGEKRWGDLTTVQYKPNWNWHYESPPLQQLYINKNYLKKKNRTRPEMVSMTPLNPTLNPLLTVEVTAELGLGSLE